MFVTMIVATATAGEQRHRQKQRRAPTSTAAKFADASANANLNSNLSNSPTSDLSPAPLIALANDTSKSSDCIGGDSIKQDAELGKNSISSNDTVIARTLTSDVVVVDQNQHQGQASDVASLDLRQSNGSFGDNGGPVQQQQQEEVWTDGIDCKPPIKTSDGPTKKTRTLKSLFIHFAGQHLNLFHAHHRTHKQQDQNCTGNGSATLCKSAKKLAAANSKTLVAASSDDQLASSACSSSQNSSNNNNNTTDSKSPNPSSSNLFLAFAHKYFNLNLASAYASSSSSTSSSSSPSSQQQRASHSCPVTPIKQRLFDNSGNSGINYHAMNANEYTDSRGRPVHFATGRVLESRDGSPSDEGGGCATRQQQANGFIESEARELVLGKQFTSGGGPSSSEKPPATRPSVRFVEQAATTTDAAGGGGGGRRSQARYSGKTQSPLSANRQPELVSLADCGVQTLYLPPPSTTAIGSGRDEDRRLLSLLSASPFVDDDSARAKLVEQLFKLPDAGHQSAPPGPQSQGADATGSGTRTEAGGMNSGQFRDIGYKLIDYICNYLDTIRERRVTPINIEPGYLKSLIQPQAPDKGEPFSRIMHDFENHIMCGITHWQHPHFHAYFPAGNAYPSILADMLGDALGCVGFSWAASPAYTELEIIMLDWMGKMIGLPDEFLCLSSSSSSSSSAAAATAPAGAAIEPSRGGGVIQGSASECVLVNLLAARHWAMEKLRKKYPGTPDGMLLTKLIGYCSKEAHSCVEKAAMIGFIRMRALDTDDKHSLRGDTLERALEMDIKQGLEPFIVCATLGTTSCVSFDNLRELGQVCKAHDNLWLHVDAAYAGSALICPEFKYLIDGIELATSFNMNPNKWMLINFDCSLMWVKDRFKLTRAFVVDPLYLQHSFSDQAIDYRHWGIPLSRRFRALKLWFVIRNYGIEGLRAYIRNHVRLAKLFAKLISEDKRFSITNEVTLGLVCFRLIGSNALNQRLLSMINASGKLHMVPASLNGRYIIRFCVCDQNAQDKDIYYAYECIAQTASELFELIRSGKERIRAISQQNTIDVSSISLHTQQSASADRLSAGGGGGAAEDSDDASPAAQQVAAGGNAQVALAAGAANKHVLRRSSRHEATNDQLGVAADGSTPTPSPSAVARSPLTKQVSVVQNTGAGANGTVELEQEIPIDSLATINGCDYDLDLDDDVDLDHTDCFLNDDDDEDDEEEDEDDDEVDDEHGSGSVKVDDAMGSGQQQQKAGSLAAGTGEQLKSALMNDSISPIQRGRLSRSSGKSSRSYSRTTTRATTDYSNGNGGHDDNDEAADELVKLIDKRNRMSLRYKREFFVRVVSDPRVYRASISGDINAHAATSTSSLGSSYQLDSAAEQLAAKKSGTSGSGGATGTLATAPKSSVTSGGQQERPR